MSGESLLYLYMGVVPKANFYWEMLSHTEIPNWSSDFHCAEQMQLRLQLHHASSQQLKVQLQMMCCNQAQQHVQLHMMDFNRAKQQVQLQIIDF